MHSLKYSYVIGVEMPAEILVSNDFIQARVFSVNQHISIYLIKGKNILFQKFDNKKI